MTNIFTTANADAYRAATAAQREALKALREAQSAHLAAQRRVEFIQALHSDAFSHARADMFKGRPSSVRIYVKHADSPSGVVCAATLGDFDEAVALMDAAGRSFPLSPTEGLRGSRA